MYRASLRLGFHNRHLSQSRGHIQRDINTTNFHCSTHVEEGDRHGQTCSVIEVNPHNLVHLALRLHSREFLRVKGTAALDLCFCLGLRDSHGLGSSTEQGWR